MTDYDSPWKEALALFFEEFQAFCFPAAHSAIDWSRGCETLDKELQQVIREAETGKRYVDHLVKVWLKDGAEEWLLVHVEVQTQPDSDFATRLYTYNYRLFDRYQRNVVTLAVLADERESWRPSHYEFSLWGFRVRMEFPTVKLLDMVRQRDDLESNPNPFAALTLAHVRTLQTKDDALRVCNLLLSCRVLGKGVEHAMVARLGQFAAARSLSAIEFDYRPTPKNIPARDFLKSLGANRLPVGVAAAVRFSVPQNELPAEQSDAAPIAEASRSSINFAWIATHRSDAASILEAVNASQEIRIAPRAAIQPRDEMEGKLTRIWERALRISPIGMDDDFFDLGGDSFVAVRILSNLEAITIRVLPLVTLFEAPTIAKLAQLLRNPGWKPQWNCLVPIKSSGSRPPFYCVHGVGGNVLEYKDLAHHIHPDQPLYGLQAIGLSGTAPARNFTIEEMAAYYLGEIREFQSHGPYYLGGSSFGGLVAYEMARQLTAASETVALVAMFDIAVPGCLDPRGVRSAWQQRVDRFRYRATLHWRNILVLEASERMGYIREKARRLAARAADRTIPSHAIRSASEAGHWAAARYVPGEYRGVITLFRATDQPPWITSDRTLGWRDLVKGGIEIYDTPGHHADLVRDPRVRVLARQLDEALVKAQQ